GVDLVETVTVLGERVADRVGAVPERGVENLHVLVDQRLLVPLEEVSHLRHHVGPIDRQIQQETAGHATMRRSFCRLRSPGGIGPRRPQLVNDPSRTWMSPRESTVSPCGEMN